MHLEWNMKDPFILNFLTFIITMVENFYVDIPIANQDHSKNEQPQSTKSNPHLNQAITNLRPSSLNMYPTRTLKCWKCTERVHVGLGCTVVGILKPWCMWCPLERGIVTKHRPALDVVSPFSSYLEACSFTVQQFGRKQGQIWRWLKNWERAILMSYFVSGLHWMFALVFFRRCLAGASLTEVRV